MISKERKKRIFDIIQIGFDEDWSSRIFDVVIMLMIVLNLVIAIFSTFDCSKPYGNLLATVEFITVAIFAVEYVLRLWTAEYLYPKLPKGKAVWRYMISFNGIIDMLAVVPYFLPIVFPAGVVAFRMFRVVRIFRLFRVNAYSDALNVIGEVIRGKRDQILSSVFIIFVLMIAASLFMYSLEHDAQPDVFQNAFSGFWWSVSTLLTVGYGDIYPITIPGRIFGIIITFLGVGMVAIPTGILSAGFVEQYTRLKSFRDYSLEADLRFIRLEVTEGHPWLDQRVKDIMIPPGLLLAVIQRKGHVVVPKGDTKFCLGDQVVIGAEGFRDEVGITLKEVVLKKMHPWVGIAIRNLDISRQTLIVMVRREHKLLIPNGNLVLLEGDMVLLYSNRPIKEALDLEI